MEKRKLPGWTKRPPALSGILATIIAIALGLLSALFRVCPWPESCAFFLAALYMSIRFQFIDKFFAFNTGASRPQLSHLPLYLLSWLLILLGLVITAIIQKRLAIAFGIGICSAEASLLFFDALFSWRALGKKERVDVEKCE